MEDDKIPVVYIKADTEDEAKEKVLEYNSYYAEFDSSKLNDRATWLDFDWLNIDELELFPDDKDDTEDECPAVSELPPIVQVWDIFQLWNHRLMCWDSTLPDDVAKLMDGKKADMIRTDPPYNVAYKWHAENTKEMIMNDKMDKWSFKLFLIDAFKNLKEYVKLWGGTYI